MTWEDILKNRRRNIKIPKRPKKDEINYLPTRPTINVDRINRQENLKRIRTLESWIIKNKQLRDSIEDKLKDWPEFEDLDYEADFNKKEYDREKTFLEDNYARYLKENTEFEKELKELKQKV